MGTIKNTEIVSDLMLSAFHHCLIQSSQHPHEVSITISPILQMSLGLLSNRHKAA